MYENFAVLFLGGAGYGLIELCWRGHTHWTMVLTGGVCLLILYRVNQLWQGEFLVFRCIKGAILITCVEFVVGLLVNRLLHWAVWDYSGAVGNLLGQVCPLYFLLWYFLCYPISGLTKFLYQKFHGKGLTSP